MNIELSELQTHILDMPEQIRKASIILVEKTLSISKLQKKIAEAETATMQTVVSAKEGDKEKYTNDKARIAAQKSLLVSNQNY